MQSKEKILMKYKLVILDVDGVLINSELNMKKSWNSTINKYKIKKNFAEFKINVGLPFQKILDNLKIFKHKKNIERFYKKQTIKNINYIKEYKGIEKIIQILLKKKIKISIVTSKDKLRTKKILKKLNIKIKQIFSPRNIKQGKPNPYLINKCIKLNKVKKDETCYIGDTYFDYLAAKRAKIDFIFHTGGFGKKRKVYKLVYSNVNNLIKLFNF